MFARDEMYVGTNGIILAPRSLYLRDALQLPYLRDAFESLYLRDALQSNLPCVFLPISSYFGVFKLFVVVRFV